MPARMSGIFLGTGTLAMLAVAGGLQSSPDIDIPDTHRIVIVGVMGIVGKAVMLLFGVMQHQAKLHPLPGQLAKG